MKKLLKSIFCVMLILCIGTLVACSNKNDEEKIDYASLESVTVDSAITSEEFAGFALSDFSIDKVTLVFTYKSTVDEYGNEVPGEQKRLPAKYDWVKADDKEKLTTAGVKNITIIYGKFEVTFKLKLYDDTKTQYKVYFYDEDGVTSLGGVQYVSSGGRATQPAVLDKEGYKFVGWIDMETGNNSTFDNITKDTKLKAEYIATKYTVEYYYDDAGEEKLISNTVLDITDSGENHYPVVPAIEGYEFSAWNKVSDTKFVAKYKANEYDVTFVYRKYADGKYSDTLTTKTVKYGRNDKEIAEINEAHCNGISEGNDYQFIYWYVVRANKKLRVDFPYVTNDMYEMTFYAYYVDINIGSEGLEYKKNGTDCIVSAYTGSDSTVVIPETALINGDRYNVVGIGDGVFKNSLIENYIVSSENKYFSVDNGVLYNNTSTILYAYPALNEQVLYSILSTTQEINPYAFYKAKNLTRVVLCDALKQIKYYAFSECTSLETVTIPTNVTVIEEGAFKMTEQSVLLSIHFMGTEITTLGDEIFYGLNSLTYFELPASVSAIGDGAFYGCSSLSGINAEFNSYFTLYNGALYDSDYKNLYVFPARYVLNENPEILVHPNCRTIVRGAFYYANISCITLQSDVTLETYSIVCPSLVALRVDSDVFDIDADEFKQAFGAYIPSIVYVNESNTLFTALDLSGEAEIKTYTEWNGYSDYYNSYSYTISNGEVTLTGYKGNATELELPIMIENLPVTTIADNAFNSNTMVTSIIIPDGVSVIGEKAFFACTSLKRVVLSIYESAKLEYIGDYAFADCTALDTVEFNEKLRFTEFGEYVFNNTPIMNSKTDFIIIGGVLLSYTGYATQITIPKEVTFIATDAFKDNGSITSVSFEDNSTLSQIDSYAFLNCRGITSIELPISLKKIKDYAFYGCEYLFFVKYNGVSTNIDREHYAFYRAGTYYDLTNVHEQFQDTVTYNLNYLVNNAKYPVQGVAFVDMYMPELTSDELFVGWYYDTGFTQLVNFPISITEETSIYARIETADYVSEGVEYSINEDGDYVVKNYNGTDKYVIIPSKYKMANVVGVATNAFGQTVVQLSLPHTMDMNSNYQSNILNVEINAFVNSAWYKNVSGDFVIYDNLLLGYKGTAKVVVIPETVSIIAEGAFMNNTAIEYVQFSSKISYVAKNLFNGCTSLKEVKLAKGVIEIKEKAFYGCTALTKINFEELTGLAAISADAFDGTAWLAAQSEDCLIVNDILYKYQGSATTLHIPSSVTSIAEYAFSGNSKLFSVYLPSTLVTIRKYAFADIISLSSVYLYEGGCSLAYIMEGAFMNCYNLRTMDLRYAENLAEISDNAFMSCTSYKTLYIPSTVTFLGEGAFKNSGVATVNVANGSRLLTIGKHAFDSCRSLVSFVFEDSSLLTTVDEYAFYDCTSLKQFYNTKALLANINAYSFYNCQSLVDVAINEETLVNIGENAVYRLGYVSSLNTNMIIFGNILVSYIGAEKIVTIPSNITLIYDEAFMGNTNITTINFETDNVLKSINDKAFYGCSGLVNINFPRSLVNVGYQIFDGTAWYENQLATQDYVVINNTLVRYNVFELQQAAIPDEVTTIIRGAFDGMSVYDILISENVTDIKDGAFDGIVPISWNESGSVLTGWTITIKAVTPPALGYTSAFENCVAIYIADQDTLASYRLADSWAFQAESTEMKVIEKYVITYNVISGEGNPIDSEEIHALYSAKDVITYSTASKQYVFVGWFADDDYITALNYPYILTSDTKVYAKCVDYDEGSNPKDYMLEDSENKSGMYTIVGYSDTIDKKVVIITEQANKQIYSVTGYLGYIEYSGNEYTKYVFNADEGKFEEYDQYGQYPEGTKTYRKNSVIEEISFANNCTIEVLGDNSFAGMTNLTKVTLPSSLKYISANAFADCVNLTEIVFSDGIKDLEIASGAFGNCVALKKVTIPSSVKSLEDKAFGGCINLKEIHLEADMPIELYNNALPFEFNLGMKIYVPNGKATTYGDKWSQYKEFDADIFVEPESKSNTEN